MFKFLRKYNKLLLAIFGVLLMITFLIPQAMNQFARQSGQRRAAVATVGNGEKVTGEQWEIAQRELHLMQRLGIGLRGIGSVQKLPPEQWYLLVREATAAGLVPNGGAVQIPDESLIQIANASNERDLSFVRNTIARVNGVDQMLRLYDSGAMYSDRRLKHLAENELYQAVAQLVVLQADKQSKYTPTDAEIKEQFEKYDDVMPGKGDHGFGYMLPDRVKLEWLQISAESVREHVRQSDAFNAVAQRVHWLKHQDDKTKNFPKVDSTPVPDVVKDDLLKQLTNDTLDKIARYSIDQLRLNRRGIPERDGYVELPADWDQRKLALPQLAASVQSEFGIALPSYESTGEKWVPIDEISKLQGVGVATTDKFGSTPIPLTTLVANSKELHTGPVSVFVQNNVAGPPLRDESGDIYLFRMLAVQKAHQPESVDEVRDEVVADLKRLADYKQLEQSAPAFEQQAEGKGMLDFAMEHHTVVRPTATLALYNRFMLMQQAQSGQPVSNSATDLPVIGKDKEVIRKALDYAMSLPTGVAVENLTEEQRVFVVPVPEHLCLAVFRLMQRTPVSQEEYAYMLNMGAISALAAQTEGAGEDPVESAFSLDSLVKRNNFVYNRTTDSEKAEDNVADASKSS